MGDSDMDSVGNFDVGSDFDLNSDISAGVDTDIEALDIVDDVDTSSFDEFSPETEDLDTDLDSLELDYIEPSLGEIDTLDVLEEASDVPEDLPSDLDEIIDIDSNEPVPESGISSSDVEMETLEIDDDVDEATEPDSEVEDLLTPLEEATDTSNEHIVSTDSISLDELESLNQPEVDSYETEGFEESREFSDEPEEHTEVDNADILDPAQESADISPEFLGDFPEESSEELGTSDCPVEEADIAEDEVENLSENNENASDVEAELESSPFEGWTDPSVGDREKLSPQEELETGENPEDTLEAIHAERDRLTSIRNELEELQSLETEETDEGEDEESPMVRTREITPEILESREHDTEETLDNYRDNLRNYGVDEAQIEEFVAQEREKINAEYESLDRGDEYPEMYETPTDWEGVAASLMGREVQDDLPDELSQASYIGNQTSEALEAETQESEVNYDEIYEGIQQEALEQGFENIQVDEDPERLDQSLENFTESSWEGLTLDEQKDSMASLADYVVDVIGFEQPPTIEYYNNPQEGDFGGYNAATNTLQINEYMLYNSSEAADTIAHELWHAHQHECATNPQSGRDYQYQYNFENYIPPSLGQEVYENQLVEAEARAFAAQFKDRLSQISGRSR